MKAAAIVCAAALGIAAPLEHSAPPDAPHPLAYWVRADVEVFGPGAWSITVRNGGYYTGYAGWLDGEFKGQLSQDQREALLRVLTQLPRDAREYSFGTAGFDGPSLTLLYQQPGPTTRYWVGLVTDEERGDARLRAVAQVAEELLRLVPIGQGHPAVPWRGWGK